MHEWPDEARRARARTRRPDVQETGDTLDPQRQHAQLLGLWSQGSKLFRRLGHEGALKGPERTRLEALWNLARLLEERGFAVRLVPAPSLPLLLLADGGGWWTLVPRSAEPGVVRAVRHPLGIDLEPGAPALAVQDGGVTLALSVWRRIGSRSLRGLLAMAASASADLRVAAEEEALVLLAAFAEVGGRLAGAPSADWPLLARLWRHRGVAIRADGGLAGTYPWLTRHGDGRLCWPETDSATGPG